MHIGLGKKIIIVPQKKNVLLNRGFDGVLNNSEFLLFVLFNNSDLLPVVSAV